MHHWLSTLNQEALSYGQGKQHISLWSWGMTVCIHSSLSETSQTYWAYFEKAMEKKKKELSKLPNTVHSHGAKKLKNIITKPWAAEVIKLSILCSTRTNFQISIKLNACYSASFSEGINCISLISLARSLEVCKISSLWNLLSSVYIGRNESPRVKKIHQGNEGSYQSDSIIIISASPP